MSFFDIFDISCTNFFFSHSIDTPGVIDRVSTLFRGHPNLIQGFNTFLPPGYRIECSSDPSDPNPVIVVTTPLGTTARSESQVDFDQRMWGQPQPQGPQPLDQPPTNPYTQQYLPQDQKSSIGGVAPKLEPGIPGAPGNANSPIEFNHAISYVNKIKTRFANQPDIYKHFLEILQTYQREQKPITEVYHQVTALFLDAPDLLDDFKQFLPDTSGQTDRVLSLSQVQPPPSSSQDFYRSSAPKNALPPLGNFQPPPSGSIAGVYPGVKERKKKGSLNDIPTSDLRGPIKKSKKDLAQHAIEVLQESQPPAPSSLSEEIGFFDKVKKAIGNKQVYNEFLKMINLYSQDIIDKETLVERVEGFIGPFKDLFDWFKHFVGYEGKPLHIENITFKKHQLELSLCKACGPSYRLLPKAETFMPCSGRDDMCWEVLNDEWVGHPTWASEDSGFIAHRKNQYEEMLFRTEEERHEYDYYMEANLRTIQTLETIANRIANMTAEEKAHFKLPPGLGHTSTTIYKKVIRKIYDKDRGFEVIDALHENPAIAVPIVLKRLKQKDEEWKRSHREWNKVWRELEQKVFMKSLDHLGLTFKQSDKKLLTTKQLISEISTIKIEQTQKRLHPLTPKPKEQLEYSFDDYEIVLDIVKLILIFLESSSTYSGNEEERLEQFLKTFISLFFSLTPEYISEGLLSRQFQLNVSSNLPAKENSKDTDESSTEAESVSPLSSNGSSKKRSRGDIDLLKDVLRRNNHKQSKSKRDDTPESINSTPKPEETEPEVSEEVSKASELWIDTISAYGQASIGDFTSSPRHNYNLFSNTTIYVFFRYFRTLYERLEEVKAMSDSVDKDIQSRKETPFAKDLGLISHQLQDMGVSMKGNDSYMEALKLSTRLIEGDIEHQWFEEALREGFRNRAYKLFTIDKVVQGLVKHMHSIVSDHRTSDMILLFEKDRTMSTTTAQDQIMYRMQVRSLMGADEHMFRTMFNDVTNKVIIQFVDVDDLTLKEFTDNDSKYNYYVTTYVMSHPTENIKSDKISMPFLRESIREEVEDDDDEEEELKGYVDPQLKVKIDKNSYKLFFDANSFDEFSRNNVYNVSAKKAKRPEKKLEKLASSLNSEFGFHRNLSEEDVAFASSRFDTLIKEGPEAYLNFKPAKPKTVAAPTEGADATIPLNNELEEKVLVDESQAVSLDNGLPSVEKDEVKTVDADIEMTA